MNKKQIIVVSGIGRCGSSLTMQMLHAGGYPTVGKYPSFEDDRASAYSYDALWISEQHNQAVKILTPLAIDRFHKANYKFIWLDRDPMQQAISQAKFGYITMGLPCDGKTIKAYAKSYQRERKQHLKHIKKYTKHRILRLTFEDLLSQPTECANKISNFIGTPLKLDKMASQVIKRTPECQKGLDIELQLIRPAA